MISDVFLNWATLKYKLAVLCVMEKPRNLREVFSGQPSVYDSNFNFTHLQSATLGIAMSGGIELCVTRCLIHQNADS